MEEAQKAFLDSKPHPTKRQLGDEYIGTAGFGKKLSMNGVVTPGRQISCFMYNSQFVFWLSWIDEMYVFVCNVDANINVLNKKAYIFWAQQILNS
jgi:hypothetical protein